MTTAALFTKAHFLRYMRRQWDEKKFAREMDGRVGVAISDIVRLSKKRNSKIKTPYLDLWIAILDEFISWQISLLTVFYALRRRGARWTNFDRSIIVILSKTISDSIAIRHLLLLGYDVAARTILRSLGEYVELFVALLDDPKLAKAFTKSDTPEKARRFWHTHLARGAIQKRIQQAWNNWFSTEQPAAAGWFAGWGRQSHSKLSGMIHPSFAGGMFSAIPFKIKHTNENWLGMWGDKSDGSVDTIYIYASYMFPMLLLNHEFPFEKFDSHLGQPIKFDKRIELHRHVKEGRFILASLILSLGKNSNHKHIFPIYDVSIFRKGKKRGERRAGKGAKRRANPPAPHG